MSLEFNYLHEKFLSQRFIYLFDFLYSLNIGKWAVGIFTTEDDEQFVVLYAAKMGVVVTVEVETEGELCEDPVEVIENGGVVISLNSRIVEPHTDLHQVMREEISKYIITEEHG